MHGPDRHGVGPGWRRRSGDLSRTDHPGSADCCIGLLILTLTEWRRTWTGATQAKQRLIESTINLFATGPCCVCVSYCPIFIPHVQQYDLWDINKRPWKFLWVFTVSNYVSIEVVIIVKKIRILYLSHGLLSDNIRSWFTHAHLNVDTNCEQLVRSCPIIC